jgi:PAS domain S-box-containing protein
MAEHMELDRNELVGFHQKKEISFTWQTSTDEFSVIGDGLQVLLGIEQTITEMDHFLALFSKQDQVLILQMFVLVKQGEEPDPIKACVVTSQSSISLSLVSAKKITDSLVAGVLLPMFISPTKEDLSSFFHQTFENQHHGMVITDDQTRIVACNTYFENFTGYKVDELLGKKTSILNAGKHGDVFFTEMWKKISTRGYWNGIILSKGKTGTIKPQELLIQKLVSVRENTYYLGMTLDLSDKLYRVAGIEYGGVELLTQLPGEQEFFLKVQDSLMDLKEDQGMLVLSFVPKFDEAQEFEHKKQLASALAYHESNSIAGFIKKAVFTIAILYERTDEKPHSLSVFEAIRQQFGKLKERVDVSIYRQIMDCTIGVSVLGLDANNEHKMISHSLQAMYERHTSNNNNICFFNRNLHEKVKRREIREEIVRRAVENRDMEVFFQPIISTKSWTVTKLEALCRFRGEDGEYLDTQEMIRVAEDMQLVSKLDLAVADKAISYRDHLMKLYGQDVEITINVSLNSEKPIKVIFNDLMMLFKKHRRHLANITVELTESAYFNSGDKESNLLFELRKKGLKVAIDDFGTGYSSFSYLKDGNFDLLKIDRDFVMDLTIGSHNYYIIKMITHLAHTLDVEVVAEGVETLQEVNILKKLKVDYLQGFYFEKPLPVQLLSEELNNKNDLHELSEHQPADVELIAFPPMLTPNHTLREVKELFENSTFNTLPVVLDRKCVGVITREQYNLHATPTLGTDRETMQEYRSLDKVVSAMMLSNVTRVHETINAGEIHEKIHNRNSLPWMVIDDSEHYVGIIDTTSMIHYLNEQ